MKTDTLKTKWYMKARPEGRPRVTYREEEDERHGP